MGVPAIMHTCPTNEPTALDILDAIAMSGGGRTGNRDFLAMAEKLGAAKVMAKPFRPKTLVEAVVALPPKVAA